MSGAEAALVESEDPWASAAWGSTWTASQGNDGQVQGEAMPENGEGSEERPQAPNQDSPNQDGSAPSGQHRRREQGQWIDWSQQSWQDSAWQSSWQRSWDGWQYDAWRQGDSDWQGRQRWERSGSDPTDPSRTPDGSVSDGDGSGGRDS